MLKKKKEVISSSKPRRENKRNIGNDVINKNFKYTLILQQIS